MKERLINVIKWFFIILGVLFFLQLLIGYGIFLGVMGFMDNDVNLINYDKKIKPMQNVIKYIEDYRNQNGKYPENINEVKKKKNFEYEYEATNDLNCYMLKMKSKKEHIVKQYQHCMFDSDGGMSNTKSYSEYTD